MYISITPRGLLHKTVVPKHWYDEFTSLLNKPEKKTMTTTIDITITLPKAQKPKRKVRVFSNFVKVGWDQYAIKLDAFTGNEFVLINNTRYEVVRDIFNQGVLVEV
jgi:hypothetical protein